MLDNQKMLASILRTAQMGQAGIRCVMDHAVRTDLRTELKNQLREYDCIEKEAQKLASQRGWELTNLNPAVVNMASAMTKARLFGGNNDSKIAGMLIQGNTRGMITGLKNIHQYGKSDPAVTGLAQRLLNKENMNIQNSQPFL